MIEKCKCGKCGVNIEFDADLFVPSGETDKEIFGQFVTCPSCQKPTILIMPKSTPQIAIFPRAIENDGQPDYSATGFIGILCAILLPLIGFFIGIYLLAKGHAGIGCVCMAASIISSIGWLMLLSSFQF
jgi:hypothetical protein